MRSPKGIPNSIRGVLRLDPGVYVLNETWDIGSLQVVGRERKSKGPDKSSTPN